MDIVWVVVDLLLVLGFSLRLTRFVVSDMLGEWWIKDPIDAAMQRWLERKYASNVKAGGDPNEGPEEPWWWKYREGLDCPWCIGFWICVLSLLSLYLVGGPGHADEWWRWIAGAFTLNYVTAHVGPRLGDTE